MMTSKLRIVLKQSALTVVFLCVCSVFAFDNGEDLAEIIATGTQAIPIKHEPPKYPNKALQAHTEGWVILSFIIREDGTTDDIVVLDASIENYFEKAAISAVSAWTYEPATRNGEPVIQYNKSVRSVFSFTGLHEGVTKSFKRYFNQATAAIREGELEKAEDLIEKLDSNQKRLISEVFYLDVLKASYYTKKGDSKATLKYLRRVLTIADDIAPENMYISLLRQVVIENAKAGHYRTALQHFNTLLEVDKDLVDDDPLRLIAERISQTIDGDGALTTEGEIRECAYCDSRLPVWYHRLSRNRFTIDQVNGEVVEMEVLCGNHTVLLAYTPGMEWGIDEAWGECDIRVSGNSGTSFRIIELANAGSGNK